MKTIDCSTFWACRGEVLLLLFINSYDNLLSAYRVPVLEGVDRTGLPEEGRGGLDVVVAVHHRDGTVRDHLEGGHTHRWLILELCFQQHLYIQNIIFYVEINYPSPAR